jgi:hypothetical protein
MAEDNKIKLYQKMFKVMEAVEFIPKDKRVKYKTVDYQATSEETVTPIFRKAFIENKLIVFPVEQTVEKMDGITQINAKYKIVDTETGEYEILASSGQGADSQDKGAGKAMTYAFKYLFFKTFFTPTGDDPDKISSAELDDKKRKGNGSKELTENQIKRLFLKYHDGDKEEAKSDYDLFKDMDRELQNETLKNIKEKVGE